VLELRIVGTVEVLADDERLALAPHDYVHRGPRKDAP
jgi:hypothetical protein